MKNDFQQHTFSIHLPIYNKDKYLRECLDSIVAQTFEDFEVICVDDGSTDNSWKILEEYASRDKRFKLYKNTTNLGTLQTRKRCFSEAEGEYMAFIDADDHAAPDLLEKIYNKIIHINADFIQFAATINNSLGTINDSTCSQYDNYFTSIPKSEIAGKDIFKSFLTQIRTNFWISVIKKNVYKSIVPYISKGRLQHGNDIFLIFMLAFFAKKYCSFNEVLYYYRANDSSSNLIGTISTEIAIEHIDSRSKVLKLAEEFLNQVDPKYNRTTLPLSLMRTSTAMYAASLVNRCLESNKNDIQKLAMFFIESFGELTPPEIYSLCSESSKLFKMKFPLEFYTTSNKSTIFRYLYKLKYIFSK